MKKYVLITIISISMLLTTACNNNNVSGDVDSSTIEDIAESVASIQATYEETDYEYKIQSFFGDSAEVEYLPEEKRYVIHVSDYNHMQYLMEYNEKRLVDVSDVAVSYVRGLNINLKQFSEDIFEELGNGYAIRLSDPTDHNRAILVFLDGNQTHNSIY